MREEPKRGKKSRISPNAKWGIALVCELIILVVMGTLYAKSWITEKYEKIEVNDLNPEELDINEGANEDMQGYTTIALFGIDARDSSLGAGSRSDSIMIVSINNDTKEIKIVSVYRDTILEIQKDNPSTNKVNGAYALGGPEMAIKTLNANLDLNITEYVTVNWEGLTRAIDALGGVDVHVEQNELSTLNRALAEQISVNGIFSEGVFETGDLTLNGAQATAYARIRSTDQGDITRTERQREVLASMIDRAKHSDMATINNVIDEIFPYVSTSITEDEMMDLAKSLMSYDLGETMGFPVRYTFYDGGSAKGSCIAPQNLTENVQAMHRFLFETEDYTPTANVQRISDELTNETGTGSAGYVLLPGEEESTDDTNSGN
jgi:LCP family protein required for cell wall assembly